MAKNNAFIIVLLLMAMIVFYSRTYGSNEATSSNITSTANDSTQIAINWLKYSDLEGDGQCSLDVTPESVCEGANVTLTSRGPIRQTMVFGMKETAWQILGQHESSSAGITEMTISAPVQGSYTVRAVSLEKTGYEGCISNVASLVVRSCE